MGSKRGNTLCNTIIDDRLKLILGLGNLPSVLFKHGTVIVNALIQCIIYKSVDLSVKGNVSVGSVKHLIRIGTVDLS